jgi:hypothetical protein
MYAPLAMWYQRRHTRAQLAKCTNLIQRRAHTYTHAEWTRDENVDGVRKDGAQA